MGRNNRRNKYAIPALRESLYFARKNSDKSFKEIGRIFGLSGSAVRYHCEMYILEELERKQLTAFIRESFSDFEDHVKAALISSAMTNEGKLTAEQGLIPLVELSKFVKKQIVLFEKMIKAKTSKRSRRAVEEIDR
jgi:hypothetical protein